MNNQPAGYMHTGHTTRAQTRNSTSLPIPSKSRWHRSNGKIKKILNHRFILSPVACRHKLTLWSSHCTRGVMKSQRIHTDIKSPTLEVIHHLYDHVCLHATSLKTSLKTGEMNQWASNASKRTETWRNLYSHLKVDSIWYRRKFVVMMQAAFILI